MPYDTYFFWVYRDQSGEYRWRLYAPNEKIVAESGEGYKSREGCENGIALVKREAPTAPIRRHESAALR
jgi:uncharacterized protein YegP (UPF0339 family)